MGCIETWLHCHVPVFFSFANLSFCTHLSFPQLQSPFQYPCAKVCFPLSLAHSAVFGHRLPACLPFQVASSHARPLIITVTA